MDRARVGEISFFAGLAWFKRDVWALEQDAPEAARRLRIAIDEHLASRTADQHH